MARAHRIMLRLRMAVVRTVCRYFLPRDVWVGKHLGGYTQKWSICFGKLDSRGVLQGLKEVA